MFRPLLFSLVILMALFGCKRNPIIGSGKTTVEGRVKDAITGYLIRWCEFSDSVTRIFIISNVHKG